MSDSYERVNQQFLAQSDNGELYTVIEYQTMIDTSTLEGRSATPGLKRLALSDGRQLGYIDANTFKIVVIDQIIRKTG